MYGGSPYGGDGRRGRGRGRGPGGSGRPLRTAPMEDEYEDMMGGPPGMGGPREPPGMGGRGGMVHPRMFGGRGMRGRGPMGGEDMPDDPRMELYQMLMDLHRR
jgi:hypothetical protein